MIMTILEHSFHLSLSSDRLFFLLMKKTDPILEYHDVVALVFVVDDVVEPL